MLFGVDFKRLRCVTMGVAKLRLLSLVCSFVLSAGCASVSSPTRFASEASGTHVMFNGEVLRLEGKTVTVGSRLSATSLIDAFSMRKVDISEMKGKMLFLSIVPTLDNSAHLNGKVLYSSRMPSLDTKFNDAQTQYLGEKGKNIPSNVIRITISRDSPYVQKRYAKDVNFSDMMFLSDYRDGAFGRSVGLLVAEHMFLARAIIIVGVDGIVKYVQVVPEMTQLPDMDKAIEIACQFAEGV